jgi:surface carbohydrate biosynthesis protein
MLDFLICYEHINREIENDALIKYELEKRGYSCEIMHFNGPGFYEHAMTGKARVVVTPWLRYDDNVFHYLRMAKRPYKLVNLQWEQVYCDDDLKSGMCTISGQARKATHICWGENTRQRLASSGIGEKKLIITGSIQMDFGRAAFNDYYFSRMDISQEFRLSEHKKWILFISSFAYANYGEEVIKELENQFGWSLEDSVGLHKASQNMTLDWIEVLLAQEDCEFIYRPHPSEKISQRLAEIEAKYFNFHIIDKYSVKQWAKVCDKVNLWISTANAEVSAMGKTYNIIRPIDVPQNLEVESMRNEEFVTDLDTFIKLNTANEDQDYHASTEGLKRMSYYYTYDAEYPAYVKVADVLEQVLKLDLKVSYHFTLRQWLQFGQSELRKVAISFIMEKQLKSPDKEVIDSFPLKEVIKQNMHNALKKYRDSKKVEAATITYMKEHNA